MHKQELERITEGMHLSDEQQNAFMLQASFKRLTAATTLPKRAPPSRLKEAIDDRVFASEKGFMKNSKVRFVFPFFFEFYVLRLPLHFVVKSSVYSFTWTGESLDLSVR